jgi:disulfide bond formation protein DsbB
VAGSKDELVYTAGTIAYCMENKDMLQFLNRCSKGRGAWLLMALTALALELVALYFQHVMLLQPCVMCIYERAALFGILGASLLGAIAPKSPLRYLAIFIWIYSAWRGVQLAWVHTMLQLHPSPFTTCDFFVSFPSWLPLDKWLPAIFVASGDCSVKQWAFMSLEMPQWLVGIFAAYLLIGVLVLISQFVKPKRRDLFSR